MALVVGYARVSSKKQEQQGNSLDEQERVLRDNGCADVVVEQGSGKAGADRPLFRDLVARLVSGDTLVVCKLDRLARSVAEGIAVIQELLSRGVTVWVLNVGRLDNTPTGRLLVTMMLAIAEWERDMILERTAEGREAARLKPGHRLDEGGTYRQAADASGLSVSTVKRRAKERKAEDIKDALKGS